MRDCELVVYQSVDPNPKYGLVPRHLRFLFRFSTEATVRSRVRAEVWSRSLDDRLLHLHTVTRNSPDGFIWGVQCQVLYPGAKIVEGSKPARTWEEQVSVPFHEIQIESNANQINLVFSELSNVEVVAGYAPYALGREGFVQEYAQATKIPLSPSADGPEQ